MLFSVDKHCCFMYRMRLFFPCEYVSTSVHSHVKIFPLKDIFPTPVYFHPS